MDDTTQVKTCCACGQTKPLEDGFAKNKGSKDGRQRNCRACVSAYHKSPEAKAQRKLRMERDADKLHRQAVARYEAKGHIWREWRDERRKDPAYRSYEVARERERRQSYKHLIALKASNSRAAKLGLEIFPDAQWLLCLAAFDGKCAYCRCGNRQLGHDHVTPLSAGGRHTPGNIVPCCKPCNSSKINREYREWMEWKGYDVSSFDRSIVALLSTNWH